ncbi:MAG: hypothetical protein DCC58_13800 [Chloroflexi bacterium]|nr:MAG: hypothetical protein DCC58_13800 [Chloroflexota bacterium]
MGCAAQGIDAVGQEQGVDAEEVAHEIGLEGAVLGYLHALFPAGVGVDEGEVALLQHVVEGERGEVTATVAPQPVPDDAAEVGEEAIAFGGGDARQERPAVELAAQLGREAQAGGGVGAELVDPEA